MDSVEMVLNMIDGWWGIFQYIFLACCYVISAITLIIVTIVCLQFILSLIEEILKTMRVFFVGARKSESRCVNKGGNVKIRFGNPGGYKPKPGTSDFGVPPISE